MNTMETTMPPRSRARPAPRTGPKGGRPRIGEEGGHVRPANPDTGRHGSHQSNQLRIMPGDGQATKLTAAAKRHGYATRADLIRYILRVGAERDPAVIRKAPEVGPAPKDRPLEERQISLIPEPGNKAKLDALAKQVGVSRNELCRRLFAYWLARYGGVGGGNS